MRKPKGKFHLLLKKGILKKGKKGKHRQHIGPPIIRPVLCSKEFRFIILKNGLKALLVSDGGVISAAAAMTVRTGNFCDPPDVLGLAHLLEHMLFVGTELEAFAKQHGGSANANTKSEHTTFEMGVHNSFLQDALERFARLFIEPLMSTEHLEKVINTVDSEFQLHKPSNEARLEQLRAHTSPKGHCFNQFPWGNKKSLSESKESLRIRLIALFNERCIASSMHLIVLGAEPLSSLQNWVNEFFTPIKDGPEICLPTRRVSGSSIWNADTLYQLQSVGQKQTMQIFWMIPALSDESYLRRPENILVQLLAQETEGSLSSFFKKKRWITMMSVEYGSGTSFSEEDRDTAYSSTSFGRMFSLLFDITDIGLEKKYEIVSYIYQYLQLVRNETLPSHVKQEYTDLLYMKFSYLDTLITDSTLFVQRLAENMITCQAQHVLSMDFLNQDYSDESIKKLLEYFIPENMRIDILSKSIKAEGCEIEPWFESCYVEEKIPVHFLENWKNVSQIDSSLHFPGENEFTPSKFSTRNHSASSEEGCCLLVNEAFKSLYYKCEEGPASVCFLLDMKEVVGHEVKTHVMTKLFLDCLKDSLCEITFQGSEAYLHASLSLRNDNRVEFTFDGYREKLRLFISRIWKKFIYFIPSSEDFQFIKETKVSDFYAELLDLSRHSDQLVSEVLEGCYATDKKFEALKAITYDDLLQFLPVLRAQICIKGIFFGDFLKDEVIEISRELTLPDPKELSGNEAASMSPSSLGRVPRRLGKGFCRRDAKPYNEFDHNSLAKVYFQVFSEKNQVHQETVLLNILSLMIDEKISEQLRDEENLGYVVKTIAETDLAIKGLSITVISPLKDPAFLLTRIYKVVEEDLWELLEGVDEETFEDYKEVVLSTVPSESGMSLWKLILEDSDLDFNWDVLFKSVEERKKEDVINFYRKYFIRSSEDCRRCEVCIHGHGTKLP